MKKPSMTGIVLGRAMLPDLAKANETIMESKYKMGDPPEKMRKKKRVKRKLVK